MKRTVQDLANLVGGLAMGRVGTEISELCPIDQAEEHALSPLLRRTALSKIVGLPGAVLAARELAQSALDLGVKAAVAHEQPVLALSRLIDILYPEEKRGGFVHPAAVVDPAAKLDPTAWIGAGAFVDADVEVGEGSWIGPNAVIMAGTRIGRFARIGPGAVIGAQGFGFARSEQGPVRLRHVGKVVIDDFVEIGANTCVDRATLGETRIGRGSKLDNLVQVGHNCKVGERTLIAGQAGLAGSAVIGDDAMLGGQAGISDHVKIGNRAKVAGKSGVVRNVADDEEVSGYPALARARWLRSMAAIARMSEDPSATEPEEEEEMR